MTGPGSLGKSIANSSKCLVRGLKAEVEQGRMDESDAWAIYLGSVADVRTWYREQEAAGSNRHRALVSSSFAVRWSVHPATVWQRYQRRPHPSNTSLGPSI